jgi:hypothetical protein
MKATLDSIAAHFVELHKLEESERFLSSAMDSTVGQVKHIGEQLVSLDKELIEEIAMQQPPK